MDLLADENQHPLVISRLREAGYRVEWIARTCAGWDDADILRRPDIGSLLLITYDRDFGELIFLHGDPAPYAILYTRLSRADPAYIAERLLAQLEAGVAAGHITTLTRDGARTKPFPLGASNG